MNFESRKREGEGPETSRFTLMKVSKSLSKIKSTKIIIKDPSVKENIRQFVVASRLQK